MTDQDPDQVDERKEYGPLSAETGLSGSTTANYDLEAASQGPERKPWLRRVTSSFKPEPKIHDIEEIKTQTLEECPEGYPRLAAFLSSESSFSLYRSFSYAHSRVLLDLQAQVVQLERELDQLDFFDSQNGRDGKRRLASKAQDDRRVRDDGKRPRAEIMKDLKERLLEYDEMLIKARELASFQRPSGRDYRSVRTWFYNEEPLVEKESQFIQRKEDVISLRSGREWSTFDGWIESSLRKFDCPLLRRLFCSHELRQKTKDQAIYYYSSHRVEFFVGLIITFLIFVLLVLPVVAMYKLTSFGQGTHGTFEAIGVLVIFTLLFCAAMSMLTKAKRHELFAASAAYCAVLVVFISNFSGSNFGPS